MNTICCYTYSARTRTVRACRTASFGSNVAGLRHIRIYRKAFYMQVSKRYGEKLSESYSLIKNINPQQQERFDR